MHDVARAAGVSVASVSRVLAGKTTNPVTIDAVQRAVDSTGYQVNAVARSLQSQRTNQVTFSVPDFGIGAYVDMLRGVESVLEAHGVGLSLRRSKGNPDFDCDLIDALGSRYTDGLILTPERTPEHLLQLVKTAQAPVVVVGGLPESFPADNACTSSTEGASIAVRHLLERGARRIAYLGGPPDSQPDHKRLRGYRSALQAAGLPFDEKLVEHAGSFDFPSGVPAATALLDRVDVDAVFAANDNLAVAAVHAAHARGLSTPDDVQVIGMDDSELATAVLPGLTSVDLRARECGAAAANLLLARLDAPERGHESRYFAPQLVVRGTTR